MASAEHSAASSDYARAHASAETDGGQTTIWLTGEHDLETVNELSRLLADAIVLTESDVIVDLSGVDFLGAAPVGALMLARRFLAQLSRGLVLRAPSHSARLVFDVCGIDSVSASGCSTAVTSVGAAPALESFVPVPATAPTSPRTETPAANPTSRPDSASPSRTGEPVTRAR